MKMRDASFLSFFFFCMYTIFPPWIASSLKGKKKKSLPSASFTCV